MWIPDPGCFLKTSLFGLYDSGDWQQAAVWTPGEEGPHEVMRGQRVRGMLIGMSWTAARGASRQHGQQQGSAGPQGAMMVYSKPRICRDTRWKICRDTRWRKKKVHTLTQLPYSWLKHFCLCIFIIYKTTVCKYVCVILHFSLSCFTELLLHSIFSITTVMQTYNTLVLLLLLMLHYILSYH